MAVFPVQLQDGTELMVRCAECRAAIETVEPVELPGDESVDSSHSDVTVETVEIESTTDVRCPTCDKLFQYHHVQRAIREYARKLGEQTVIDKTRRLLKKPGISSRQTRTKSLQPTGPFVIE